MEFFSHIFYFLIVISLLVLVHEFGHFATAKLFRMRVDRFSIGLGPRAFGRKFGETDYCISWIPFGGYVKIAGMIDESFDTEFTKSEPQPWEFRSKPVWQRLIVILAGVAMNIVLAVLIFSGMNLSRGREMHKVTTIGVVADSSLAARAGIASGDRIVSINGESVEYWEDVEREIAYGGAAGDVQLSVLRGAEKVGVVIRQRDLARLDGEGLGMLPLGARPLINTVDPGRPAEKAGLKAGDRILLLNGKEMNLQTDVIALLQANPETELPAVWLRDGDTLRGYVSPDAGGKIGISITTSIDAEKVVEHFSIPGALAAGFDNTVTLTVLTVTNIWHIISGKASFRESIGGPVKIAKLAAKEAEGGILRFLGFLAILSISLAIINLFPIPALDGGFVIFLLYELIFRREIPTKVQISMLNAGWVLLIGLMVLVVYNDIFH